MVDSTKAITNLVPTIMAAGLVRHNLSSLRKKKKSLINLGVSNIVGLSLIKSTAQLAND